MEYDHDLKLSSKHDFPYFTFSENSGCSMTVKPDHLQSLEIQEPYLSTSDETDPCLSRFLKNDFSEKYINPCLPLKEEIEITEGELALSDTTSMPCPLETTARINRDKPLFSIEPLLDIGEDYFSEISAKTDIPLRDGYYKDKSEIKAHDFIAASYKCDVCRNVPFKRSSSLEVKIDGFSKEMYKTSINEPVKGSFGKPKEILSKYLESLKKIDWINVECLRTQFFSFKEYSKESNLFQEEHLSRKNDFETRSDYSKDSGQKSILFEENELKCENLEMQKEYLEEFCRARNNDTTEEIYLGLHEKSNIREKHFQDMHGVERKNLLKSEYSKVKIDCFQNEPWYCDAPNDDRLLNMLCDVFDFICNMEENALNYIEKQNLVSEIEVKCENIHSEPYCVKSIRILLYFLEDVKNDLVSKEKTAFELKLDSETQVNELNSNDFEDTKESKDLKETAINFVSKCDKLYASIKQDREKCEWYSENLKKMLNFLQEKCCFISNPAI